MMTLAGAVRVTILTAPNSCALAMTFGVGNFSQHMGMLRHQQYRIIIGASRAAGVHFRDSLNK